MALQTMRKYSKSMFAILAIVCMFTFVLSSGLGGGADFFDQIGVGGTSSKSPEVATAFGQRITQSEIEETRIRREIANSVMMGYIERSSTHLAELIKADLPKLSPGLQQTLTGLITAKLQFATPLATDSPQSRQQSMFRYLFQIAPQAEQTLGAMAGAIKAEEKPEDAAAISRALEMLQTDRVYLNPLDPKPFFFQLPMNTDRDMIHFIMWQRKAQRMGVRLLNEDIQREVMRETNNVLRPVDAVAVERAVRARYNTMTPELLRAALADEFQVRIALNALQGRGVGIRAAVPTFVTPREFFDFFKDQCSETKYLLFDVPASDFLTKVEGTPTTDEVQKLYNAHRAELADPSKAEAGFKEPRKVAIQWVTGDPESAYYKQRGAELIKLQQGFGQLLGAFQAFGGGVPVAAAPKLAIDSGPLNDYDFYLSTQVFRPEVLNPSLLDISIIRPETVAGLVGQTLGSLQTGAGLLSGPLLLEGMAIQHDGKARVVLGLGLLGGNPLVGAANWAALQPDKLPFEAIRPRFQAFRSEDAAQRSYLEDLRALYGEIAKLGGKPTAKADIAAYIESYAKPRGLQVGVMPKALDATQIADDSTLVPLKDVFQAGHSGGGQGAPKFGEQFFEDVGASERTKYLPQFYPNNQNQRFAGNKMFIWWRTEDVAPLVPPLDAIRDRVVAAWKLQKARELAKAAAEKLSGDIALAGGNRAKLIEMTATQKLNSPADLGPAAKLLQEPGLAGGAPNYRRFEIPKTIVEFQTPDMANDLLSIRNEKIGTTRVLNDLPLNHYYVAVLMSRDEKTEANFADVYARTSVPTISEQDPLFTRYADPEADRLMRKDLLGLLKVEANYTEVEKFTAELDKLRN